MNDSQRPGSILINDTDLALIEMGTGDPLVFVHGSVGDYRAWEEQLGAVADRYRTVAYSRRYHWPNTHPPEGTIYRADEHAADLIALLEARDLAPAHVVCESYGGVIALTAAVKRPELFRTLVLNEPPLFTWLPDVPGGADYLETFMVSVLQPAGRAFRQGDAQEGMRLFLDGVLGAGTFESFPPAAREASMDNAPEMTVETNSPVDGYFPDLTRDDAARLGMPVLLVDGALSPPIFGAVTNELARVLPNVERVTIPDASHVMHVQNPAAYNAAVLDFLDRQSRPAST